jgi:GT2 family glycosyltransferase
MVDARVSVVVATYNREEPLVRLLTSLARQTLPREEVEIIVVDDGSRVDVAALVAPFERDLRITLLRQANSGVAIARQQGVERACARTIVFLDDDMLVKEDFLAQHLAVHEGHDDRVVMGRLLADAKLAEMPLFERFHARMLDRMAQEFSRRGTFSGHEVYTGNLSLPREFFLRVGGFDPSFHIEDVELGVRLEEAGAKFFFSTEAASVHASDHTSLEKWLARSKRDGRDWVRLARKHPAVRAASPWRHLRSANPLLRPFFGAAVALPRAAPTLARLVFRGATRADVLGLDRVAVAATTVVYGIQYFAGVREETGGLRDVVTDCRAYLRGA